MVWCYNCTRNQPKQSSRSSSVCCHGCGKVVNQETGSKKRSFSGVAVEQHEQEAKNLKAGKSLKIDLAKFRAFQTALGKNAKGAVNREVSDDSESLSDIDDAEIRSYLIKGDEMLFKKMMWEKLNEEYIKAEAAKKAAAANAMKLKKEKQRQAAGAKKSQDTAKAANKRTSSRVNYDVLKELLGESEASEKSKKRRADSYCEDDATSNKNESGHDKFNYWGIINDNYDEENGEKYQNDPYHDNEDGQYYDDVNGDDLF